MSDTDHELKNIVEAALLIAYEPLSIKKLKNLFPADARPATEQVDKALQSVAEDWDGRALELRKIGNGYRLQSRGKYAPWLRKLNENRPPRYSRAMLETLAIIAYRQPVTRGDIEEIRGVSVSTDIMRNLLDRGWINDIGHREVPGHPTLFGTTRGFLEYFNLTKLSDLPPLRAKREPADIARDLELRLPGAGEEERNAAAEGDESEFDRAADEHVGAEIIHLDTGSKATDTAPDVDGERETP